MLQLGNIVIRSEDDAWRYLEAAVSASLDEFQISNIKFEGWPSLEIYLSTGHASLTAPTMEIFIEFQKAIWRSFALLKYGEADTARLKDIEKESLKFEVVVADGSTDLKAKLGEAIMLFAKEAANKVNGKNLVYIALGVAFIYGSHLTAKEYLQYKLDLRKADLVAEEKIKQLDTQKFLSEKEAEKLRILQEAFNYSQQLRDIDELADPARQTFLSNVPQNSTVRFQGVEIDGAIANELAKNARNVSLRVDFEGDFRILKVDAQSPEGFRVWLRNEQNLEDFPALLRDGPGSFSVKEVIKAAVFEKKTAHLRIQGSRRAGRIVGALISGSGQGWKPELVSVRS